MTILTIALLSATSPVPDAWLNAVAMTESSNQNINGDRCRKTGVYRARGIFQFHAKTWRDCSKLRKSQGKAVYPYSKANDEQIAREYAKTWLTYLKAVLTRKYGRAPSVGEVWLAYNMGLDGFGRYHYDIHQVPQRKMTKAVQTIMAVDVRAMLREYNKHNDELRPLN